MSESTTEPIKGSCHCGAVEFEVTLVDGFNTARRCTCSYCRMRGAVAVSAKLADFAVVEGEDALTEYQFNTKQARHFFCSVCGIYTHHQRRSRPDEFGVNVACLEGHTPFEFRELVVYDGERHPRDLEGEQGPFIAGVLRFEPAEQQGRGPKAGSS